MPGIFLSALTLLLRNFLTALQKTRHYLSTACQQILIQLNKFFFTFALILTDKIIDSLNYFCFLFQLLRNHADSFSLFHFFDNKNDKVYPLSRTF